MNPDIQFATRGCAGLITLDKQETMNAVTAAMLQQIDHHLDVWENDDRVSRIIIKASPGRAFSAGGDIRHLYERGIAKDYDFDFFAHEYQLNARIASFSKPYIALIDGIAMGGGVGVSYHGSHVVAGGSHTFAMPEVGIGFFPDVGGSYLLSRLPGKLGLYLGLTGERVKQGDAVASGLADYACASERLTELEDKLCEGGGVDEVLSSSSEVAEPGPHMNNLDAINAVFSHPDVSGILKALEKWADLDDENSTWAQKTLDQLHHKSPTSLEIAFRQIERGADLSMDDCMRMEYRILRRILPEQDFYEGIRAAIIDKDGAPQWQPSSLTDVDLNTIELHFSSLGEQELEL